MEEITITQNGFDCRYMSYLFAKVKDRFSFLPADIDLVENGDLARIEFRAEGAYCPYVRRFAEEHIADVIAVGYKYAYFEKKLPLPLLEKNEKRLLLTALVAADYKEDKAYALRRIKGNREYCVDGVFRFRLQDLVKRWKSIVDYVPTDMGKTSLDGFLEYLVEDCEGKVFVKDGKVYDAEYRPLSKSQLTSEESVAGEILLSGAGSVYCLGKPDSEVERFLKKYYGEKAIFC